MPKSKEEIRKILEENYGTVQQKEFDIYEEVAKLKKTFTKDTNNIKSQLTNKQKENKEEHKKVTKKYKKIVADFSAQEKQQKETIELKRQDALKVLEDANNQTIATKETKVTELNEKRSNIEKEFDNLNVAVLTQYEEDVQEVNKKIDYIIDKGVKDTKTFKQKIDDLKAKFEAKVESLNEKEAVKIQKLQEASDKKVKKIQETIENEQSKLDKKLAIVVPTYEEELAEIDENLDNAKQEYETKHSSIKTSAEQRIAVREKHLKRAIDDKDQRSVKLHKKDIDKFKKEADRDLVLLLKKYNQDNSVAIDYRKNFIKEHFDKLSEMDKEFSKIREEKQLEIDEVLITLTYDVSNTKLEYQKLQQDELVKYNQNYAEIKEKEIKVEMEKEQEIKTNKDSLVNLNTSFDNDKYINEQRNKEALEINAKEVRDANIIKDKEDFIAQSDNQKVIIGLDKDVKMTEIILSKELEIAEKEEQIELHNLQHILHNNAKDEFLSYQKTFVPLYSNRAAEVLSYEEMETNNRYKLKISFLEHNLPLLEKDRDELISKINDVFMKEKYYFDEKIEQIAGDNQVELDQFLTDNQQEITEVKEKINALNPRKDKKEIKALQIELEAKQKAFKTEKESKESQIYAKVKVFKDALNAAENRKNIALVEAEQIFELEVSRLKQTIDQLKSQQDSELEAAKKRYNDTTNTINDFATKAATRNQLHTEENNTFVEIRNNSEKNIIEEINNRFSSQQEKINNMFNEENKNHENNKVQKLNEFATLLADEESNLESFRNDISATIKAKEDKTASEIKTQNEMTEHALSEIANKYQTLADEVAKLLTQQEQEYNNLIQENTKKVSEEKQKYEQNKKRIQKEYEVRLKEDISNIDSKLKQDINSIK